MQYIGHLYITLDMADKRINEMEVRPEEITQKTSQRNEMAN